MKLSASTVEVLKNFSTISQGLVITPGNKLRTISSSKAILAEAVIPEEFKFEFGIYDLSKLLGVLSMTKDQPEITLEKEFLTIKGLSGKASSRIRYTASNLIPKPPAGGVKAEYKIKFKLDEETLDWIFSISSVLKCPNVVFEGIGGEVVARAMDVKGEVVDDASVVVGVCEHPFKATLKIENLKLIPGAYTVEVSHKGVTKFTSADTTKTYYIALENGHSKF